MARPLRRVLIGLAIRTGIGIRELEQYDIPTLRGFMAMLEEINKPSTPPPRAPIRGFGANERQSEEELISGVKAALGHLKE